MQRVAFWACVLASTVSCSGTTEETLDTLRLFPIVGPDLLYPVASLLARGRLEDAAELVSDRAWVASAPLYG